MKWSEALARRNEARALLATAATLVQSASDAAGLQPAIDTMYQAAKLDAGFSEPHWHLAELYEYLGNVPKALEGYISTVRLDPLVGGDETAAARVYANLGRLLELGGRTSDAVRYYNRFLTYFPLATEAPSIAVRLQLLAECGGNWLSFLQDGYRLQQEERHEAAIASLDQAARLYPAAASIYFLRALCWRACGQHDEAVRNLESAVELDMNPRTYVEMGATYLNMGNSYVEEGFYERALEIAPQDSLSMYMLGTAAYSRKDRARALQMLQQAVELSPDASWAAKASSLVDDLMRSGLAGFPECLQEPVEWAYWRYELEGLQIPYPAKAELITHLETGYLVAFADNADSRSFQFRVKRSLAPDPFDVESFFRLTERSVRQMLEVRHERLERTKVCDLPALLDEYREVKTDCIVLQAWVVRGDDILEFWCRCPWPVYQKAGDICMGMIQRSRILSVKELHRFRKKVFEECVQRQPNDVDALASLGGALLALNDWEGAQKIYQRILALDPRNAHALGDLGLSYWQQGKLDLAIQSLTTATATNPQKKLMRVLGMAYERKGKPDMAVKVYLRALESRPDKELRLLLGVAYESMKRYDQAEREYTSAFSEDPSDFRVHLLLGGLYRRTKRPQEAMAQFREALELDSQSIDAGLLFGVACIEASYWDLAEKTLRNVLKVDPANEGAADALKHLEMERKKARRY